MCTFKMLHPKTKNAQQSFTVLMRQRKTTSDNNKCIIERASVHLSNHTQCTCIDVDALVMRQLKID